MCEACKKLKGQDSWITIGQKVLSSHSVIWRLELATHPSCESLAKAPFFFLQKNGFSPSFSDPTINTLIPTKCRELPERILKEKP